MDKHMKKPNKYAGIGGKQYEGKENVKDYLEWLHKEYPFAEKYWMGARLVIRGVAAFVVGYSYSAENHSPMLQWSRINPKINYDNAVNSRELVCVACYEKTCSCCGKAI